MERFNQNQDLFKQYTTLNGATKKQTIHAIDPIFLSPIKYQQTGFGQVMSLDTMNHLFRAYGAIDEIYL